jgi:hypothetical protein
MSHPISDRHNDSYYNWQISPQNGINRMATNKKEDVFETDEVRELIGTFKTATAGLRSEVGKVIIGQDDVVEHLLITLLVGGHCLITGMPGTAKTLLVHTLADALGLTFKRIQFTPDLMPTDVTGTDIIEEDAASGHRSWTFVKGPIFTNVLLADEINRTPPKTQAALLEAMQERSVTVRGNNHQLEPPVAIITSSNRHSSCWQHRIRLNSKAPTRCPKRSSIDSCLTCYSTILVKTMNWRWSIDLQRASTFRQ